MIEYPILTTEKSELFKYSEKNQYPYIYISSDDPYTEFVSKQCISKSIYFHKRSKESSNDTATLSDVLLETIKDMGLDKFNYICLVLPTAFGITVADLIRSQPTEINGKNIISVLKYHHPIERAFKIENDSLKMVSDEHKNTRTQDLTPTYHDAGQFYWVNVKRFLNEKKIITDDCVPYILDKSKVHDIDNPEDWEIAERKYRAIQGAYCK